jgi:hypothetical protein
MQKLTGTSSGKNNKSCGIFHNKSNKIEFAFFWFFYDFLRILQESAKWLYYLRFTFAAGSLKSFRFLRICPWLTENTLETFDFLQCHPRGWRPVRAAQIPASSSPAWPGKAGRLTRGSPQNVLWARMVEKGCRWGWSAVPGGDRR